MNFDLGSRCSGHKFVVILVLAAMLMIVYFFYPFLDGIILGTVFAYVGRPMRDKFSQHKRLGSLAAVICIVVPIFLILGLGTLQVVNQISILARNQELLRSGLGTLMAETGAGFPLGVKDLFTQSIENAAGIIAPIAASIPLLHIGRVVSLGIINFLISIPICYFLLMDGDGFKESIISLLPQGEMKIYRKYIDRIDRILSGIYIGTIYTSILGSLIAALTFYVFGLPRPFALASIVFVAGMVPFLTSWTVIVPLTVYRYFTLGLEGAVIFFVLASSLIYLPSELLIRPYLVSAKSSLHPLLVMLSFLGGALVAGIGGFFLAPAIMGAIVGIYQVRREEMAEPADMGRIVKSCNDP